MSRWVFYLPVVVIIAGISFLYFYMFGKNNQSIGTGDESTEPENALNKKLDEINQDLFTDIAMLVSFPIIIYVIVLPSALHDINNLFSIVNLLFIITGTIAVIYVAMSAIKRHRQRNALKNEVKRLRMPNKTK